MSDSIQPTPAQVLLSIYKMVANTNAEMQMMKKIVVEMRFKLNEVLKNTNKLDEQQTAAWDLERPEFLEQYEKTWNDTVPTLEKYAMKVAFDWAFENDTNAIDLDGLGIS